VNKRKLIFSAVFLLTGWSMLSAQTLPASSAKKPAQVETKSAQELKIENLILIAHTAPPEVAADILLTLSASTPTFTKDRKKELIEDAFRFATDAREPIKRKPWSRMVDTRAGLKGAAFELELDKLSLQARAVIQMISIDQSRARTMFQEIVLPKLPELTCEDSLSYDFTAYYRAALRISQSCFDRDEVKAEAHVQFLSDRLSSIKSISQVVPAAYMITDADLTANELSLLVTAFIGALGKISTNARDFAFVMDRDRFTVAMQSLLRKARDQEIPTTELSRAIRAFLIKQMTGEVCQDAQWVEGRVVKLPRSVTELNRGFSTPLEEDDGKPLSFGAVAKDRQFWTRPREKQLLMFAKDLRFGGGETPLTLEQRKTDEWRKKMVDYLALIESWEPESEVSADDYFKEKCILYGVLVDLSPDDAQRDVVLRAYANYLREQNGEYKGRIEWILPVKHYLQTIGSMSEVEKRKSLDAWLSSSDAALRAYAELALLRVTQN